MMRHSIHRDLACRGTTAEVTQQALIVRTDDDAYHAKREANPTKDANTNATKSHAGQTKKKTEARA